MEKRDYEGARRDFWGDMYVYYLGCGDGFEGIFMSKLVKLYTLYMPVYSILTMLLRKKKNKAYFCL